jgi:hypothetical protein
MDSSQLNGIANFIWGVADDVLAVFYIGADARWQLGTIGRAPFQFACFSQAATLTV